MTELNVPEVDDENTTVFCTTAFGVTLETSDTSADLCLVFFDHTGQEGVRAYMAPIMLEQAENILEGIRIGISLVKLAAEHAEDRV